MLKRIAYSCVVDNDPKYSWQCFIFITTLIHIANVSPKNIFIHVVEGGNHNLIAYLESCSVNIIHVERWGDGKYCNKLVQFETLALQQADYVFLCDCDIAFCRHIENLANSNSQNIVAKIVDRENPPLFILKKIYKEFNIELPAIVKTYSGNTLATNCNGGFIGIPGNLFKDFGKQWKRYVLEVLNNNAISDSLGKWSLHIDQIAFSLSLNKSKFTFKELPPAYNLPIHIPDLVKKKSDLFKIQKPAVLHYHSRLDIHGLIKLIGIPEIDSAISVINQKLRQNFINKLFWDYRYSMNPELGSGIGSRGKIVPLRQQILKQYGIDDAKSILDVGFGDMEILSNCKISNYTGVELSHNAIDEAKIKHPDLSFVHYSNKNNIDNHELVICLDVLIHQESPESFYDLIHYLIDKTEKRLIVSGYIRDISSKSHMIFFYENLETILLNSGKFIEIQKCQLHKDKYIFIADKVTNKLPKQINYQNQKDNKIFVHIGMPKTGSTAIQKFCKINSDILKRNGVNYPSSAQSAMNYLAFSLLDNIPQYVFKLPMDMNKLYGTLNFNSTMNNMLSAEAFFVSSSDKYLGISAPYRLKLLLPKYLKPKIVIYLRRQDHFLISIYKQYIKLHAHNDFCSSTIVQFQKDYESYLNYYAILQNWSSIFGRENIIVRVYEDGQLVGGSLISDYLSALDIEITDEYKNSNELVNFSLSADDIEFKRLINILPIESNYKLKIIPDLLNSIAVMTKGKPSKSFLSNQERLELLNKYKQCNENIAKEYLHREDGVLFYEPLPKINANENKYSGLSTNYLAVIRKVIKSQNKKTYSVISEAIIKSLNSDNVSVHKAAETLIKFTPKWKQYLYL